MTAVLARCSVGVKCRVAYRLIDDDIAIANLDVVEAVGIGAYPRLELNGRALAAKIRQRNQISRAAFTTAWECVLDPHLPVLTLHWCWSAQIRSQEPYFHCIGCRVRKSLSRSSRWSSQQISHLIYYTPLRGAIPQRIHQARGVYHTLVKWRPFSPIASRNTQIG